MSSVRPLACLLPNGPKIALIILNRPVDVPLLTHFWKKSIFTAATDGAVNQLHYSLGDRRGDYLPNIITGDFDSADMATLDYYRNKAVDIIATPDQDETDFTKCLRIVSDRIDHSVVEQIVVIGAFGGRMDHCMANINTLFTGFTFSKTPIYLFYENSMACLLNKGEHTLRFDTGLEGDWVGLVPVGQATNHVTTTGLKYNLTNQRMAFGELISTSNSLADKTVQVSTDQPLLWLMGYELH